MTKAITWQVCLLLLAVCPVARSAEPVIDTNPLRTLSQRVWALQTMHDLDFTADQLKHLGTLAPETMGAGENHKPFKAPAKYATALQAMHDALLKGEDDDQISELRDDLESLVEDLDLDLDDNVTITQAARAKAGEVVHMLAPSQVAAYMGAYQDDAPDPVDTLMTAADDLRGSSDEDAQATIDQTAEDLGILLGGLLTEKSKPVEDKVRDWLKQSRAMSDADFKGKRADLEKSAKELAADTDPFIVLRHWLERDIAEMLSNPQLASVIEAKLHRAEPAGNKAAPVKFEPSHRKVIK